MAGLDLFGKAAVEMLACVSLCLCAEIAQLWKAQEKPQVSRPLRRSTGYAYKPRIKPLVENPQNLLQSVSPGLLRLNGQSLVGAAKQAKVLGTDMSLCDPNLHNMGSSR